MSRVLVFDLDNRQVDEFSAICQRGWTISDGGSTTLTLDKKAARKTSLDFGRMIFVDHPQLPGWAGMIDTPWGASAPVTISVYDVPYLLRVKPYGVDLRSGNLRVLAGRFLTLAGQLTNHGIQLGDIADTEEKSNYPVETTAIWDQIKNLATVTNTEIQFRSQIDVSDRRLVHYLDMLPTLGKETDLVLFDGQKGNSTFGDAKIDGDFKNAIRGTSSASTGGGKTTSDIIRDDESITRWRLRNDVVQFNFSAKSDLNAAAQAAISSNGRPTLAFTARALVDKIDASKLRLGNTVEVRASRLRLPRGEKGWKGQVRITAMSFDETSNTITMAVKGGFNL